MRLKKRSVALEIAKSRYEGLKNIDPTLDLGNGMTNQLFSTSIMEVETMVGEYNSVISDLDGKLSAIKAKERSLRELRERMLLAVAVKYGKDSVEYVFAGGVRKSERKRPKSKMSSSTPTVEN